MRAVGGADRWVDERVQRAKLQLELGYRCSPLVPAQAVLTSRFVGVLDRHQVGVHLHRLGREARWVEGPRLGAERHPQVAVGVHFEDLPHLAQHLGRERERREGCARGG